MFYTENKSLVPEWPCIIEVSYIYPPTTGDPDVLMAEMLSLRFETTAPDSLFLALFLRRLPASIRDHLAAANHTTATEMATHADILWDLLTWVTWWMISIGPGGSSLEMLLLSVASALCFSSV